MWVRAQRFGLIERGTHHRLIRIKFLQRIERGKDLTWSLSTNYKPNFGFASVVGRGNQSPIIKYISYSSGVKDLFRIQVSDGTGYEELEITAIIVDSFDTFNVDAPEEGKQIFSGSLYEDYFKVSSSIEGSELRMVLVNGPNWLKVEKVKHGLFRLSGMAPLNVNGSITLNLSFLEGGVIQ